MCLLIWLLWCLLSAVSSTGSMSILSQFDVASLSIDLIGAISSSVLGYFAVSLMQAWLTSQASRQQKKGKIHHVEAQYSGYTDADIYTRRVILIMTGIIVNTYGTILRIVFSIVYIIALFIVDRACVSDNRDRKYNYAKDCEENGLDVKDGYQPHCRWGLILLILTLLSCIPTLLTILKG